MDITLDELESFCAELQALSFPQPRQKTFLELIDLHRIESVSSKFLAFLLDSHGNHGLGNLALRAMLIALGRKASTTLQTVEVLREVKCSPRRSKHYGFVDIAVELHKKLIVIENKINHKLNNPFDLYIRHFNECYPRHERIFILMGNQRPPITPSGYCFISHAEFGHALKNLIENSTDESVINSYYRSFTLDYIEAMNTMAPKKRTKEEQAIIDFSQNNYALLDKLDAESANVQLAMRSLLEETIQKLEFDIFDTNNFYDIGYDTWALLGYYASAEYIRIPNATHKVALYAHWSLKYVYVTVEMYTRNVENDVSENEVNALLEQRGVSIIQDDEIDETVILLLPALGMTPQKFAKELKKLYGKLTA